MIAAATAGGGGGNIRWKKNETCKQYIKSTTKPQKK